MSYLSNVMALGILKGFNANTSLFDASACTGYLVVMCPLLSLGSPSQGPRTREEWWVELTASFRNHFLTSSVTLSHSLSAILTNFPSTSEIISRMAAAMFSVLSVWVGVRVVRRIERGERVTCDGWAYFH